MARVEYRKVQEDVEGKLTEGFSLRIVYEDLTTAGRLEIGYSTFCDYVRGKGERLHSRPKKQAPVSAPKPTSRPSFRPSKEEDSGDRFVHERNVDLKDLI
jgi:hypothetical protein